MYYDGITSKDTILSKKKTGTEQCIQHTIKEYMHLCFKKR